MISRVSSVNKGKQAKRKNRIKNNDLKKKNGTKKQKTAWPGVEPGSSARCKQLFDHCTTALDMF